MLSSLTGSVSIDVGYAPAVTLGKPMSESNKRSSDERKLVAAGLFGLAISAVFICCSDGDVGSDKSSDAGANKTDACKKSDSGSTTSGHLW
jgi:hypothetical protein